MARWKSYPAEYKAYYPIIDGTHPWYVVDDKAT